MFQAWCSDNFIDTPGRITLKALEQYRRFLFQKRKADGTGLKASTQNNHLCAVRVFCSWMARRNLILFNPASELDLPRREHLLPRNVISPDRMERIMALPNTIARQGIRDRAILETFYSTGIRRQELINLEVRDLDPDRGLLMIRQGKGGKDRMVPIGERACAWIVRYLREVRPFFLIGHESEALFITHGGRAFHPHSLNKLVRVYLRRAGIEGPASCHLLRHSMATAMLDNGADIRFIQAILGHEKLTTTQIYTRVSILKLKEVHARTHPASVKKKTAGGKRESGEEDNADRT
jgi:integrase/recombinase XerD